MLRVGSLQSGQKTALVERMVWSVITWPRGPVMTAKEALAAYDAAERDPKAWKN
jgi:hypothetical protein